MVKAVQLPLQPLRWALRIENRVTTRIIPSRYMDKIAREEAGSEAVQAQRQYCNIDANLIHRTKTRAAVVERVPTSLWSFLIAFALKEILKRRFPLSPAVWR